MLKLLMSCVPARSAEQQNDAHKQRISTILFGHVAVCAFMSRASVSYTIMDAFSLVFYCRSNCACGGLDNY